MSFCSNCGNKVKEGTKFCSKCGASLSNESESINNQHNTNLKIPCPKCSSLLVEKKVKKDAEKFGGMKKKHYLCTRF